MFYHILLFLVLYAITKHLLHKISNLPPSPFPSLPVIGHLHLLRKPPLPRALSNLSDQHGPVMLLQFGSRRVLVISSPSAAEECLSKNDIVFANRPRLLAGKYLGYNYTSQAFSPYGELWRNLRKLASLEILSPSRVHSLSGIRVDEVRSLVKLLAGIGRVGHAADMKTAFLELTQNMMMRMIGGKRYCGEGMEATESEEAREFREIVEESFRLGGATNISEFLPFLKWVGLKGVEGNMIKLQEKNDGFMQRLIDEHRRLGHNEEEEKSKTLIQVMLSLQEIDPVNYTDDVIKANMLVRLRLYYFTSLDEFSIGLE